MSSDHKTTTTISENRARMKANLCHAEALFIHGLTSGGYLGSAGTCHNGFLHRLPLGLLFRW
jgi:hypothetical protein